jgi:hypothetical protein
MVSLRRTLERSTRLRQPAVRSSRRECGSESPSACYK